MYGLKLVPFMNPAVQMYGLKTVPFVRAKMYSLKPLPFKGLQHQMQLEKM